MQTHLNDLPISCPTGYRVDSDKVTAKIDDRLELVAANTRRLESAAAGPALGSGWSIQPTPTPTGAAYSILSGVSCTTATACTAVGDYVSASGTDVTWPSATPGSHRTSNIHHNLVP